MNSNIKFACLCLCLPLLMHVAAGGSNRPTPAAASLSLIQRLEKVEKELAELKASSGTGNKSMGTGGGGGYYRRGGSGSRSEDTFEKIVAGYFNYQAGKRVIRSLIVPMMWNNRPYYWGLQYHPDGGNQSGRTMCQMPIDPQVRYYTQEGLQLKEIVWSCGMRERCCDYECCPAGGHSDGGNGNGGGSRWNSSSILLLSFTLFAWIFIIY